MIKLFFTIVFSTSIVFSSLGQTDTLKVMSYNLLNFPNIQPNRIDTLAGILSHIKPDILMVCELNTAAGADNILFNALNIGGETSYEMATFVNGPDTDNELFYNGDKLTLYEQNEITTPLRDINEYVLFYNSSDIASTSDTVFLYVYVCHLKASTGWESQRFEEAQAMKSYMATRPGIENIILGGDFNFYSSTTEPAWDEILTGSGVTLKDPINSPGNWNSNAGYAPIHTQSTRVDMLPDGGSTGGMDSRFDFIFLSPDAINGSNEVTYIPDSYRAVGQDGFHYNKSLLDTPVNTSEPWNIITNLYYMSDHLPIYLELEVITAAASIKEKTVNDIVYFDSTLKTLVFFESSGQSLDNDLFEVVDMSGRIVKQETINSNTDRIELTSLVSGIYIVYCKSLNLEYKFIIE